ncbi:MAG: protein kinase [Streptosporangiaceae bacterium]|jgi:hypothetical protein
MGGSEPDRLLAGRYRLRAVIGEGGMGAVWRAHDELLNRDVAVKEIIWPPQLDPADRETARLRATREAQMAARLRHPNVVGVYDFFEEDDRTCIVMELVPYRSLRDAVRDDGPLSPADAAQVGLGVLAALAATHQAGVLHRDVKPANILLGPDGRVVLTDFGIAKAADSPALTSSGVLIGSPSYIAPERARGGAATAAADLWALGASLYTAVEGRPPFDRDGVLASLTAVVADEPDPARHAGPLGPVISGLLRKDPEARLGAAEAEQMLARVAGEPGVPAAPRPAADGLPSAGVPDPDTSSVLDPVDTVSGRDTGRPEEVTTPASERPAAGDRLPPDGPAEREPAESPAAEVPVLVPGPPGVEVGAAGSGAAGPGGARGGGRRRARVAAAAAAAVGVAAIIVALLAVSTPGHPTAHPGAKPTGTASASTPAAAAPAPTSSPSSPGSSTATAGSGGSTAVPAGYYRFTNSTGFSIGVPTGWQISHVGHYVYIRDPVNSGIFLLIDQSDQPKPSALADWQQQAANRGSGYPGYHLIRLQAVVYAQAIKAADWEFSYDRNGIEVQVLNRNVLANAHHAYALYWSTPVSDWNAYYHFFQAFAATFRPASVNQTG